MRDVRASTVQLDDCAYVVMSSTMMVRDVRSGLSSTFSNVSVRYGGYGPLRDALRVIDVVNRMSMLMFKLGMVAYDFGVTDQVDVAIWKTSM